MTLSSWDGASQLPLTPESQIKDMQVDIAANRRSKKYTSRELIGRVLWSLVHPLFRFSPRKCFGWRGWMLRVFGASIGNNVHIYPNVRIFLPWNLTVGDDSAIGDSVILYNLGPISLGQRVTVSQNAHLCSGTHDYRLPDMPLIRASIRVEDEVWICADAFVGPDVCVQRRAIVGARAAVFKDVGAHEIVGGNPAKLIKMRDKPTEESLGQNR
jgi:putative colanic acid biosynthesis acetyltransferase WcaF